jgi:hypothetical protein
MVRWDSDAASGDVCWWLPSDPVLLTLQLLWGALISLIQHRFVRCASSESSRCPEELEEDG